MPAYAETSNASASAVEKDGLIYKGGVVMMAPIPNDAPAPAIAEPAALDLSGKQAGASHCLATAIYFEARGESLKGQRAVGEVIMKRTRQAGRPKTVCGVVYEGSSRRTGCQFSFTCDGIADKVRDRAAWARAKKAAAAVLRSGGRGKFSRGATHYHANYVTPYWASSMRKVARIGTHIFYRE
jgi:spore germination cell wall hydrolase CwlJ-like protein